MTKKSDMAEQAVQRLQGIFGGMRYSCELAAESVKHLSCENKGDLEMLKEAMRALESNVKLADRLFHCYGEKGGTISIKEFLIAQNQADSSEEKDEQRHEGESEG